MTNLVNIDLEDAQAIAQNIEDGDEDLWRHLRSMERGDKGHFAQALFRAAERADGSNRRKLYNAFFDYFNP